MGKYPLGIQEEPCEDDSSHSSYSNGCVEDNQNDSPEVSQLLCYDVTVVVGIGRRIRPIVAESQGDATRDGNDNLANAVPQEAASL